MHADTHVICTNVMRVPAYRLMRKPYLITYRSRRCFVTIFLMCTTKRDSEYS